MPEYWKRLAIKIAAVGTLGVFIANNSLPYVYNAKIRKTDQYQEAVRLLHSHSEAIKYLGEPIKEGRVNVTKPEYFGTDGKTMWYVLPVIGKKATGKLFYDCSVPKNEKEQPKLLRVELTLDKIKDYKLLIKKSD